MADGGRMSSFQSRLEKHDRVLLLLGSLLAIGVFPTPVMPREDDGTIVRTAEGSGAWIVTGQGIRVLASRTAASPGRTLRGCTQASNIGTDR